MILKDKRGFEMEFLLKILLWVIFAGVLFVALYSIFKRFGVFK